MKKSEIYAQGYEPWEGERKPSDPIEKLWRHPISLVARMSIRNITLVPKGCLGRLMFIVFVVMPMAGFFFFVIASSVARFQLENLKKSDFLGGAAAGFAEILENLVAAVSEFTESGVTESMWHMGTLLVPSLFFVFFVSVFYTSQMISKERQVNALQVYFSKAVSRLDYLLGKFVAVGVFFAVMTLLPSAIIIVLGLVLSTDFFAYIKQAWYVPFLTGAYWLALTTVAGGIGLFFSASLSKSYQAAVGFVGFLFFLSVASTLLGLMFGEPDILVGLDMIRSLFEIGRSIYELDMLSSSRLFWQTADMLILAGLMIFLTYRRINPVEVIK